MGFDFQRFVHGLGVALAGREFSTLQRENETTSQLKQVLAAQAIQNPGILDTKAFQELSKKVGGWGEDMEMVFGLARATGQAKAREVQGRQASLTGQLDREVGAARGAARRDVGRAGVALQGMGAQGAEARLAATPPEMLPEPLRYARSLGPGGVRGTAVDPAAVQGATGVPQVTPQAIAGAATEAGEVAAETEREGQKDIRGLIGAGLIDEAGQAIIGRPAARAALRDAAAKAADERVKGVTALAAHMPAQIAPMFYDHVRAGGSTENLPVGLARALEQAKVEPSKVPAAGVAVGGHRERLNKVLAQHAEIAEKFKGVIPRALAPTLEAQLQSANADYISTVLPEKAKALLEAAQQGALDPATAMAQLQDDVRMNLMVWTKDKDGWIPWAGRGDQKGPRVLGVVTPGEEHSTNLSGIADLGGGNRVIVGATGEIGFDGPAFKALAPAPPPPDDEDAGGDDDRQASIESALGLAAPPRSGAAVIGPGGPFVAAAAKGGELVEAAVPVAKSLLPPILRSKLAKPAAPEARAPLPAVASRQVAARQARERTLEGLKPEGRAKTRTRLLNMLKKTPKGAQADFFREMLAEVEEVMQQRGELQAPAAEPRLRGP